MSPWALSFEEENMRKLSSVAGAMVFAGIASAQLQVSIGIRETGFALGPDNGIGGNGGSTGGIEWVNLDGQTLITDNTWQQFSFTLATATLTGFAGTSANGILEGNYGTLEHIRIRNAGGTDAPITIWVDDITNTVTPPGGGPTDNNFGTFEGYADNTEVMFQEPNFSGSTAANLVAGGTAGVDNAVAHSGSGSYRFNFQFVDTTATRWARLTSFSVVNQGNPIVRFDQSSVVTFWAKAVPEPATMITLGLGAAALLRRRRK